MNVYPPEQIYVILRNRARQIVHRFLPPDFYNDFPEANALSRLIFNCHPIIFKLRQFVFQNADDDLGHGFIHAKKVTLDAGALIAIECERERYGADQPYIQRQIVVVQCAGLLHDMMRKMDDHAVRGASFAREILKSYPLRIGEIEDICQAIRNHEAFKLPESINTKQGSLISDCLYDADKFRWGPDNFSDTLWKMMIFTHPPLSKFIERYPLGMKKIADIKTTFRTKTGKAYGPQFIDIGLEIGNELFLIIQNEFVFKMDEMD